MHVRREHLFEENILLGAYRIYTEPILFICIHVDSVMADIP